LAVAIPTMACVGALVWPGRETLNGAGGLFGWGQTLGVYETGVIALLAARWAAGKASDALGRVMFGLAAAMVVVAGFMVLQVVLLIVDQHDDRATGPTGSLTCGLTDNDLGCHNVGYFKAFIGGVVVEAGLVCVMLAGVLACLLASRLSERWSMRG
jgi:hypothetical protein